MLRTICYLAVIGMCLSGCAGYSWNHPSKGERELKQDEHKCLEKSVQAFPFNFETKAPEIDYTSPPKTSCNEHTYYGKANCEKIPDIAMPPPSEMVDANEEKRDRVFDSCMKAKGWALQKK